MARSALSYDQPPIADYALLSDSQGSALVSRAGSIDWACLPHFDSPATFARLLGAGAGHWKVAPTESAEVTRSYIDRTLVLRTECRTSTGSIALTDALVFMPLERGHGIGQRSPHAILRLIEGIEGTVEVESDMAPRPEYGLTIPRWEALPGGGIWHGGPQAYVVSCPNQVEIDDARAVTRFSVSEGDRVGLAFRVADPWRGELSPWSTDQIRAWLYGTIRGWQSWAEMHQGYEGPWADLVHHSRLVLQGLTFAPTGAVVAAPTTSLPESIGGERNWDYRYAWVRDASLTLKALWIGVCPDEIDKFFRFFVTAAGATRGDGEDGSQEEALQILYGIHGERRVNESELKRLDGYRDSQPVRIGNAAWRQHQLDVYGELIDAAALYADRVDQFDAPTAAFLADMADQAADRWDKPDHGIWEIRGEPRNYLHSKLMCWVALDRATAMAERLGANDRLEVWCRERERIRRTILDEGWNDTAKAFTQSIGSDDLDASSLLIPIVGFLPADDSRVRATIEAIAERLTDERGLVYRYRSADGLGGEEGAFGICTYWLAQAHAMAGDVDRARECFETMTSFANDVGLMAEEVDSKTGELLGNFPQAFTHVGLINAAHAIAEAERKQLQP